MKLLLKIRKIKELDDGGIGLCGTLQSPITSGSSVFLMADSNEAPLKVNIEDIWKSKTPDGAPGKYVGRAEEGDRVVLELYDENLDIDDIQIGDQIFVRERSRQALSAKPHQESKQSPKAKKPIYKKWWFWVIIVAVILVVIIVATPDQQEGTQNSKSVSSTESISKTKAKVYQKVTPQQLHKERHDNAAAAKDKWDGKNIEMTGKFDSIDSDGLFFQLEMVTEDSLEDFDSTMFYCYFTNNALKQQAKTLKKGQTITIKGTVKDVDDFGCYEINVDAIQA